MQAIVLSIIANLLRFGLIAFVGFLFAHNVIDAQQSATVTAFFNGHVGEASMFILTLIVALLWKGWAWLSHFQIVKVAQGAMGLKVTGVADSATVATAKLVNDPTSLTADAIKAAMPMLMLFGILAASFGLTACSTSSPFVARSEARPGDGKIPVAVTASVNASGSTASTAPTDYTGGVAVTFGKNTTPAARQAFLRRLGLARDARPWWKRILGIDDPDQYPVMDGEFRN